MPEGHVLSELDTISDFVQYLGEKESLASRAKVVFEGEENLLALYVHGSRSFPDGPDFLIAQAGMWDTLVAKPDFKRRTEADRESYVWDRLIEDISGDLLAGNLEMGPGLADCERGLRVMARENRFSRRILGKRFVEFLNDARARKTKSRLLQAYSETNYVFFRMHPDGDRDLQIKELQLRCFMAQLIHKAL